MRVQRHRGRPSSCALPPELQLDLGALVTRTATRSRHRHRRDRGRLRRLGQMHDRAGPQQQVHHQPPTARCLRRHLQFLAADYNRHRAGACPLNIRRARARTVRSVQRASLGIAPNPRFDAGVTCDPPGSCFVAHGTVSMGLPRSARCSSARGVTAPGVKQPRSARRATTSPKPVLVLGRASQPPTQTT